MRIFFTLLLLLTIGGYIYGGEPSPSKEVCSKKFCSVQRSREIRVLRPLRLLGHGHTHKAKSRVRERSVQRRGIFRRILRSRRVNRSC